MEDLSDDSLSIDDMDIDDTAAPSDEQILATLNKIVETHEDRPFKKVYKYKEWQFVGQVPITQVADFVLGVERLQNCRYIVREAETPTDPGKADPTKRTTFTCWGKPYFKVSSRPVNLCRRCPVHAPIYARLRPASAPAAGRAKVLECRSENAAATPADGCRWWVLL
jgi:hypothetical protein